MYPELTAYLLPVALWERCVSRTCYPVDQRKLYLIVQCAT